MPCKMANTAGGVIIPIILLSLMGVRRKTLDIIFSCKPSMWVVWWNGFELFLDDLSCSRGQDWACGMKEMSSDAVGVVWAKHPPAHILTCFQTCSKSLTDDPQRNWDLTCNNIIICPDTHTHTTSFFLSIVIVYQRFLCCAKILFWQGITVLLQPFETRAVMVMVLLTISKHAD